MKVRSLHLSIPTPCHEDWDKMTPTEKGRHCQSCQKEVVDFTLLSDQQILARFAKNNKGLCGRFRADQLDRQVFLISPSNTTPWAKAGLLAASLLLAVPAIGQQSSKVQIEQLVNDETSSSIPQHLSSLSISGTVVDEEGEPLIAANLRIKGTSSGTVTDLNGWFQVNLNSEKDTIVVSYIGFKSQEIKFSPEGNSNLELVMEKGTYLDEIVVTAPGSYICRGGMVGSISVVSARPGSKRKKKWASPLKPEIKVFPNPFISHIQIELDTIQEGEYNLRIVANTGQVVHQLQLFLSPYQRLEMDLAALNLPAGTYWLQISDGKEQNFKQQLIKINP
ncbi:MAG: carboxypeptidase-like regulatory domain-containing protein [Saprospiraceae bacterium]|nr:carboxypeptidase-like regulatory domain-containing protein [Saprospiraceae bacterium]